MKRLSLLSMVIRFLYTGLLVIIASVMLDVSTYGNYVVLLSSSVLLTSIFEFGLSFSSLVIKSNDEAKIVSVIKLSYIKDFFNFLLSVFSLLFLSTELFVLSISIFIGASVLTWQSIFRISGKYKSELLSNVICLVFFAISLIYLYVSNNSSAIDFFFFLVVVPKFASFVFTAFSEVFSLRVTSFIFPIYVLERLLWKEFFQRIKTQYSYWMQSVLNVASSNVDVLIASMFLTIGDVGKLKIITTVILMALVLPEIFSNYSINERVNRGDVQQRSLFGHNMLVHMLALVFGSIASISQIFLSYTNTGSLHVEGSVILSVFFVVFLRIYIILYAANLTVIGLQLVRFKTSLLINISYWVLVLGLSPHLGVVGCLYAIVLSTILHCLLFVRGFKR